MTPAQIQDELELRGLLELVDGVASAYHVTTDEIMGRRRTKRVAAARHETWRRIRELGFSYPEIAAMWGVDHSSVMYGITGR